MKSVIDLEAQQVAQAAPHAGAFFSFFLITVKVVTFARKRWKGPRRMKWMPLGLTPVVLQAHCSRCLLAKISTARHS
jgi:hypothetical protein